MHRPSFFRRVMLEPNMLRFLGVFLLVMAALALICVAAVTNSMGCAMVSAAFGIGGGMQSLSFWVATILEQARKPRDPRDP